MGPTYFGNAGFGGLTYHGVVKVKLVHAAHGSLIVPDQLYLRSPSVWFQPKTFLPCTLARTDSTITCTIMFDIDATSIALVIESDGLLGGLPDGSFLYECKVDGPRDLVDRATGTWEMRNDRPHLRLFHHTDQKGFSGITTSGEFWSSPWNIQGTRKLANIGYVYFTDLQRIQSEGELAAIAMSPRQRLYYLRDGAEVPIALPHNWKSTPLRHDVLEVEVYWSAPEKRDQTLVAYVDASLIAPSHLLCHNGQSVWYEVSCPSIFRVGLKPGATLSYDGDQANAGDSHRVFDYMVMGDATVLSGLAAPLDEENTSHTFRIHRTEIPPLEFWFENPNQDHFTRLRGPEQEFEDP